VIDGQTGSSRQIRMPTNEPEILIRMIRAGFSWGRLNDVRYCYFFVNRALARILKGMGIVLTQVGESTEHRGIRTPYIVDVAETERRMLEKIPLIRKLYSTANPFEHFSRLNTHQTTRQYLQSEHKSRA
jgi:N-acyl amino acid synthase of PEP-CTERM/exosortase system